MRAFDILLLALAVGWTSLADAAAPLPAPPPMPAAPDAHAATAAPSAAAPQSAAGRPPAAAAEALRPAVETGLNAATASAELGAPSSLEQLPPAHPIAPETRIEQIRQGNRVAEIRVTPAGSSRSYVIVAREPSRQHSLQDSGTGLSTPRFVRIEF